MVTYFPGKMSSKKVQKRSREVEEEDDVYDRQVSSTSADKNAKKRKKSSIKVFKIFKKNRQDNF